MNLSNLGEGGIKSIQRGISTVTAGGTLNVTITAVNLSKAVVLMSYSMASQQSLSGAQAALTTTTNLALAAGQAGGSGNVSIAWQVLEYK